MPPGVSSSVFVVTPPPTPNGRLHVGHVSGPYLRADLFVRLRRSLGLPTTHLSHIDVYQSYIPKKARQLGRDPEAFLEEMIEGIERDFATFHIERDRVVDNRSNAYVRFLDGAVAALLDTARVEPRDGRACSSCGLSLYESNVKGRCASCLHECYQNVCENCCRPQTFESLLAPVCGGCASADTLPTNSDRTSVLVISTAAMAQVRADLAHLSTGNRRLLALLDGLEEHVLGFTYDADYGVDLDVVDGNLNPWVEIYFAHLYGILQQLGIDTTRNFATCARQLHERAGEFDLAYFLGADNLYYYAVVFTLLSRLLAIPEMLPVALQTSFFLLLNDAKVSSSRNNVIWAADMADDNVSTLRGKLALNCPEFTQRNFSKDLAGLSLNRVALVDTKSGTDVASLLGRLEPLAAPERFNVETIVDVFAKGSAYARNLEECGDHEESHRVDAALARIADSLDLA